MAKDVSKTLKMLTFVRVRVVFDNFAVCYPIFKRFSFSGTVAFRSRILNFIVFGKRRLKDGENGAFQSMAPECSLYQDDVRDGFSKFISD